MQKIFAGATAVALALAAGVASSAEWTGTVEEIAEGSGKVVISTGMVEVADAHDAPHMKLGDTADVEGAVERIDQTAGTVMVGGQEFVLGETAVMGVPLDELQEGDQVRVVYQDAGGRLEVVELTKVE